MLSSIEQSSMLSALGCPNDQAQIKIFLEKAIDPTSGLTPALLSSAFSAIYTNSYGGIDTSIDFLIENHKRIAEYFSTLQPASKLILQLVAQIRIRGYHENYICRSKKSKESQESEKFKELDESKKCKKFKESEGFEDSKESEES